METFKLVIGLLVLVCFACSIGGFFKLINILPEGDVDNKLASEKYRRRMNSRIR